MSQFIFAESISSPLRSIYGGNNETPERIYWHIYNIYKENKFNTISSKIIISSK